jgi:aminopeptidase N
VVKNNVVTHIPLDAVGLNIQSVSVDYIKLIPTPSIENDILLIPLPSPATKGTPLKIIIEYRYDDFKNVGFFYHSKGSNGGGTRENVAFTVNSPEYARFWFPCNDTPGDKAALTMKVKVPYEYTVASNGRLANIFEYNPEFDEAYKEFT